MTVASQEADESVRKTRARYEAEANSYIGYHSSGSIMDDRMASKRARLSAIGDELEAVIRASERERYAALVEGVRALHNGHGGTICYSACRALAALEEAGSA